MRKLTPLLLLLPVLTVLAAPVRLLSQATTGSYSITTSGGTQNIANSVGGLTATFEELPAGSPATVSVTIQGCMRGNTCDSAADTNTSTSAAIRPVTFTKAYNYFKVTASWTGGTNASVTVNYLVTSARTGGGGAVDSVFGRTGAVVATSGDYTCAQVTNCNSGAVFQSNGVGLTSQSTINFQDSTAFNGLTFTFTNPSAGNVKAGFSGLLGPGGIGTLAAGSNGLANSATTDATNATNITSGTLPAARESSSVVQNNITNTAAAGMILDLSGMTGATAFKVPVIAGATAGANGVVDYDSTAGNTHVRTNAADSLVAAMAGAIAAGTIPKATDATHSLLAASALIDNGTVITSSEGLAFSSAAGAATTISTTTSNASMHLAPNGTGQVLLDTDGAVATPAIAFNSQAGFGFARQASSTFGLTNGTNFYILLKSGSGIAVPGNAGFYVVNNANDATNSTKVSCLDNPTTGSNTWRFSSDCSDKTSPVSMTIRGQGSRGGTDNNIAGGDITYQSGPGTGNSTPSRLLIQAPGDATASGTTQQPYLTRIAANITKTLSNTSATATTVFTLGSVVANRSNGGVVHYDLTVSDGTDWCSLAGEVTYVLVAKASTVSSATSTPIGETKIGSGTACATLSSTWAFSSNALQITPSWTAITPTTVKLRGTVINSGEDSITSF